MATYTSHYQLHQWEASDSFLRTDFNTDFQKIDAAIKGVETDTEEKLAGKAELIWGNYTGNGAENRKIALGFQPRAVVLFAREAEALFAWEGMPYQSQRDNKMMLAINANGFRVHYGNYLAGSNRIDYQPVTNKEGEEYRYLVVK